MQPRLETVRIRVKRGDMGGYFAAGGIGMTDANVKADDYSKNQPSDPLADRPVEEGGLKKGGALGGREVQAKMDEEQAQGYRGFVPDPTPNGNYTVAGVTSGAPTPENNPDAAAKAGSSKFAQVNAEPAPPAERVTLTNSEGREIRVSDKLRTQYPEYKESK